MTSILLNGRNILLSDIKEGQVKSMSENEGYVLSFIQEWLDDTSTFTVNTSGSTGKPKAIHIPREKMIVSAKKTIEFLESKEGGKEVADLEINAMENAITSVPTYIINDRFILHGGQEPETFESFFRRVETILEKEAE